MGFNWLLSQHGFYTTCLQYSGDQNVLINDWYACLQVLSKQLTVWNAYLSLLGYNLVIAPVFSFEPPTHWDRRTQKLAIYFVIINHIATCIAS